MPLENAALPQLDSLYQSIQQALPWITAVGIVMAVASMVAIPLLVVRMPADYFVAKRPQRRHRGALAWLTWSLRNALAILLIIAGIIMLALPGQGVLTIMIGIACSTFPGKYALQRRFASRPKVLAALNWIRQKYGHEPLIAPHE
jgi:hypothetical protein